MKVMGTQNHRITFFALTAALLVLCANLARAQTFTPESMLATGPYWSPDGGKLAFSAAYNGNYDIYVINLRRNTREQVTDHPANELYPSWSPSGQNLAFYSDRESFIPPHPPDTIIYNVRGLYETYARDGYKPSWSPDGNTILAHLRSERGNYEIYSMNRRGRERKPLTWNLGTDVHPRFSPDGNQIVFVSDRDNQPEIYVMDADGKNQVRLTNSRAYTIDPVWSPDGSKIAYISNASGFFDIYVMNRDGSNKTRLTKALAYDLSPTWSPDGTELLFSTDRNGGIFDLFVMDADGSNLRQITTGQSNEHYGAWSPDGQTIAYLTTLDGQTELFLLSLSSGNKRKLTR